MVVTIGENRKFFLLTGGRPVGVHTAEGFRVGNQAIDNSADLSGYLGRVDFINDDARTGRDRFPRLGGILFVKTRDFLRDADMILKRRANEESRTAIVGGKGRGGIESGREVMFLPDRNLGANVSRSLGRRLELWPGFCPTHNRIVPETVREMRRQYPGVELLVHPECVPEVVSLADAALSTGGMLRYVRESSARRFLIGTEHGILHRMRKENPGKEFIGLSPVVTCPNMKKLTLDSIVSALETMEPRVELPEPLVEVLEHAQLL